MRGGYVVVNGELLRCIVVLSTFSRILCECCIARHMQFLLSFFFVNLSFLFE